SHTLIDDEFDNLPPVEAAAPESAEAPVAEAEMPPVEALFGAGPATPVDSAEPAELAEPVDTAELVDSTEPVEAEEAERPPAPVFVTASGKPSRSSRGLLTVLLLVVLAVAAYAFGLIDRLLELIR
ncbi:MAG: hypothetical protein HKM89_09265, partial [Gemmatimonadales bacterium]|nr:hypothetical protein [Gemmatimonadales bacterium]